MTSTLTSVNTTWVATYTFTTGELITKTILDTYLSAELNALKDEAGWISILDETAAEFTTTSASFAAISASYLTATITTGGGDVIVGYTGTMRCSANANAALTVLVDGVDTAGEDGMWWNALTISVETGFSFITRITGLSAASHSFALAWKTSAGTLSLRAGFNSPNLHSRYFGYEIGNLS